MHDSIINLLLYWVKSAGYLPDVKKLRQEFLSHPDIGSLASVTDTLTALQIESAAAAIPFETITSLSEPFLAYVKQDGQERLVLTTFMNEKIRIYDGENDVAEVTLSWFKNIFTGFIVVIDKNKQRTSLSWKTYNSQLFAVSLTIALSILFALTKPAAATIIYYVPGLVGFVFCSLLIAYELGNSTNLVQKFCTLSARTQCRVVLHSKAAKITQHISLTDLGIIYFSNQVLALIFFPYSNKYLFILSILATPFVFFSVYQQALVIKKWCPFCLVIISVILLQGIISLLKLEYYTPEIIQVVQLVLLMLSTIIAWYFIRPLLHAKRKVENTETALKSFKRNYHLFLPYYKSLAAINDLPLTRIPEIIIGNKNSKIKLTLIISPLCQQCKLAWQNVMKIFKDHPQEVCIRLVFHVTANKNDAGTMIAAGLYHSYINNRQEGVAHIEKWLTQQGERQFEHLQISETIAIHHQPHLQVHHNWCMMNNLTFTPALLVNNKLLPLVYDIPDLKYQIGELIATVDNEYNQQQVQPAQTNRVLASDT